MVADNQVLEAPMCAAQEEAANARSAAEGNVENPNFECVVAPSVHTSVAVDEEFVDAAQVALGC